MKYIDIHCHLDFPDYDADRADVLGRMKEKEISAITIGTDFESSKKAIEIAEASENTCSDNGAGRVWATIGAHPENLELFDEKEFEKLVSNPKVVAIGECGLEYFVMDKEKTEKLQRDLFEEQIQFAIRHDKPMMLHIRPSKKSEDAYLESLEILESCKKDLSADGGEKLRGNIHFFAGSVETAKRFLDLGFTLSFTGVITFTDDYDDVIRYVPDNSIMSETDSPFVAPTPFRGKRNEPAFVDLVVEKMAKKRKQSLDFFEKLVVDNSRRVFGI